MRSPYIEPTLDFSLLKKKFLKTSIKINKKQYKIDNTEDNVINDVQVISQNTYLLTIETCLIILTILIASNLVFRIYATYNRRFKKR